MLYCGKLLTAEFVSVSLNLCSVPSAASGPGLSAAPGVFGLIGSANATDSSSAVQPEAEDAVMADEDRRGQVGSEEIGSKEVGSGQKAAAPSSPLSDYNEDQLAEDYELAGQSSDGDAAVASGVRGRVTPPNSRSESQERKRKRSTTAGESPTGGAVGRPRPCLDHGPPSRVQPKRGALKPDRFVKDRGE